MNNNIVTISKNPTLDWAMAIFGGKEIPTAKEDYKPIPQINIGSEIFDNLYQKKPDKKNVQEFKEDFTEALKKNLLADQPYDSKVEVILVVLTKKSRLFEVDVDNLSKTLLDAMKGAVFKDDKQVVKLFIEKQIHPANINGLIIGVNSIDNPEKSWFNNIKPIYLYRKGE